MHCNWMVFRIAVLIRYLYKDLLCFSCPYICRIWYFLANCHANWTHIFSQLCADFLCVCLLDEIRFSGKLGYLSIFHSLQGQMEAHWSDTNFAQVQIFQKTPLKYEKFQLKIHNPDKKKKNWSEVFDKRTIQKLCSNLKAMILKITLKSIYKEKCQRQAILTC